MPHSSHIQVQALSPYDMEYFDELNDQVTQMQAFRQLKQFLSEAYRPFPARETKEVQQVNAVVQKVLMSLIFRYLEKQRKALQRNSQHCRLRNLWYKDEIKKSWQIAISNRPLVLRSLARTNILKREADEWLSSIDDNVLAGYVNDSFANRSQNSAEEKDYNENLRAQNQLKGSKLLDKYNQILSEYYHKI